MAMNVIERAGFVQILEYTCQCDGLRSGSKSLSKAGPIAGQSDGI